MGNRKSDDMTSMETLIRKSDIVYQDRWDPHNVHTYESYLSENSFRGMRKELRKNISYSLQYLEFLQLQLDELKLHSIIEMHIWKTFIVTAIGIVESIFYFVLKKSGNYKKEEWKVLNKPVHTNVFNNDGMKRKYIISLCEKLEHPEEGEMDLEAMINKVQSKELISISGRAFPYIKHLKRLRNKVHLQICHHENDTDYMKISNHDYLLARYLLRSILTCDTFSAGTSAACFGFLRLSPEQVNEVKDYISNQEVDENVNTNGENQD